jgi:hypothetical protein
MKWHMHPHEENNLQMIYDVEMSNSHMLAWNARISNVHVHACPENGKP